MKYAFVVVTALAASTLSLAVQAQDNTPLTRAEVQADLAQAQQAGLVNQNDVTYPRQMTYDTQQTQAAATTDATQSVGGAMPAAQSGSRSADSRTVTPQSFNNIFQGGS